MGFDKPTWVGRGAGADKWRDVVVTFSLAYLAAAAPDELMQASPLILLGNWILSQFSCPQFSCWHCPFPQFRDCLLTKYGKLGVLCP